MTDRQGPLTIAHVTGESGFSGGEVQVFLLMEGLRDRGHRNVLIGPPRGRAIEEAQKRGFECRGVPMLNSGSPLAIFRIARALREIRPAVVHLHTGRADRLASIGAAHAGIPCVSTRRMDRTVTRSLRNRWLYGRGVARTVAISSAIERLLLDAGAPPDRVRVIWSAVDPAALRPTRERGEIRRELGVTDDTPCILILATLVARKGIDVLIDAFAALEHDARLWVAGKGAQREEYEAQAKRLGCADRVRFLGPRDDSANLLDGCDVFVLPSRREGLGVAALEAMAVGKPVVGTTVGGLGETVQHEETGLLVPSEDAPALAAALDRLLGDPSLRVRLGEAGPKFVAERHHPDAMTSAYEALYREVLAESDS